MTPRSENQSTILLRELRLDDEAPFVQALNSWPGDDSFMWGGPEKDQSFSDYSKLLEKNKSGIDLPSDRVEDTILFAFNNKGEITGRANIRHRLNDFLLKIGGHIGYAVPPNHRKNGYGTEILRQALVYCKEELRLDRALVTCDENNIGSQKIILNNNGFLENQEDNGPGRPLKNRYWITL